MKQLLTSAAVALALTAPAAHAEIVFGSSPPGIWNVVDIGAPFPLLTDGGPFTTSAAFGTDTGTAHFGMEMLAAATGTPPVFPVIKQTEPGETLSIAFTDGDEATGHIVWASVDGGNPKLEGTFDYTASGDPAFLAAFGEAGAIGIELVADMTGKTLEDWDSTHGPVTLQPMDASEPAALAVLGVGLLALGMWRRWGGRLIY